ncbi:MAG: S-layer homology domain-containing protein [Clostridia bacterium]|nr:S-layer homology domain-containing protein [Clostridia bacterium]
MKRIISIFIILSLTFCTFIFANAVAFSDVKDTDYYAHAASLLKEFGVLDGYPDGTFKPQNSINRAEMAAIVCRMIAKDNEATDLKGKTDFTDVASSHWATGYINFASSTGIINGDGNGNFRPGDQVKYEEAIKMVVCALGYGEDVEMDPDDWSAGYIKTATDKGITKHLTGQKGIAATRGDIAMMAYNGINLNIPY